MPDFDVRRAAVAGSFYPRDPDALRRLVLECLGPAAGPARSVRAAIAPHAGLAYSGRCAGAVFRAVALPSTVIILAPNHTGICGSGGGASVWARGAFSTPLGRTPIATDLARELIDRCPLAAHDPEAHHGEHAIEVELPFIQELAPRTAIVPVVLAWDDWPSCETLAQALADVVLARAPDALILASSDMTHYESAASAARKDRLALAAIERLDGRALLDVCRRERVTMCGRAPAAVVVEAARRLGSTVAETVDYRHSGMVTGDDSSVVAYAGILVP
jgi:AmmeMemoRadiSam system protein B